MATEIDICNMALTHLGQKPVSNILNPVSYPEQLCALWYPQVRDSLLEWADWSFATKRATLTAHLSPVPIWGFANAFHLPADCLRVIWAGEGDNEKEFSRRDWRIEGQT